MLFLTASLAFGLSVFMMIYTGMTQYFEHKTFQRRLHTYSRAEKGKKNPEDYAIDAGKAETSSSRVRKSLFRSLYMAFFFSFPMSYAWYYFDPKLFSNKWLIVLLVVTIVFRFRHIKELKRYNDSIEEDLPRVMDLLIICIEAGMSINSAMMRVAEETKGTAISDQFKETFYELNAGVSVEDAFMNLSDRARVPDLQALTTSIVQSEKLGVGLVETMRSHSVLMRETLRLRTKEKILKLPVKMILPLVIFILPAVFTILAGPVYLQVQKSLFSSLKEAKPAIDKAKDTNEYDNY